MNHLDFVLWMLLYPIVISTCCYIDSKYSNREYRKETQAFVGLFQLIVWLYVGWVLY